MKASLEFKSSFVRANPINSLKAILTNIDNP